MADESFSPETHRGPVLRACLRGRHAVPDVTIHNQDKELVMDGLHRYLLRRKP